MRTARGSIRWWDSREIYRCFFYGCFIDRLSTSRRLFYHLYSFCLLIPSYQLLPHESPEYICDVGSEIVRSFVSFLWYCLGSVTGLAWPSVSDRCNRLTTPGQGRSLVLSMRSTL